jgi:outer membrane protein assembly factor BamB
MKSRFGCAIALGFFVFTAFACDCGRKPPLNSDNGVGQGPSKIDFGTEQVGQTKTLGGQVILTNTGGGMLAITGSLITGPNAGDYALQGSLPTSVEPGGTIQAALQFSPAVAGTSTATLQISTDNGAVNVPLTGMGVLIKICAQPPTVDFGSVQVGGTPATQMVTLTNCGESPANMVFQANPIAGPNAGDYSVTGQANTTLQPGSAMTLTVSFFPSVLGASTADVGYQTCGGCSQQQVNLTGVGIDCALTFVPTPVTFGSVAIGNSVDTQVTVTNSGTNTCIIGGITTKASTTPFQVKTAPSIPINLAVGANFPMTMAYAPFPASVSSDTLLVIYTVPDTAVPPRTAPVPLVANGTPQGCILSMAPSTVNFGSVNANSPVTKNLTLNNNGGAACQITNIAIAASSDPGFVLASAGTTSVTVQPGVPATIGVMFSTTTVAAPYLRTGSLTFQTNDTTQPTAKVPLNAYLNNTVYASGWPKWHFDNRNSGQSEADTAGLTGTIAWKFNVGAPTGSGRFGSDTYINSPVVDTNGNVYQVGMSGTLYAVNANGVQVWTATLTAPTGDPHPSTPAILNTGNMFVISGSDNGKNSGVNNLFYVSSTGSILSQQVFGEDGFDACPALGNDGSGNYGTLYEADDDGPATTGGSGDPYSAIAFSANGNTVTQIDGLSLPLTNESERFGIAIADDGTSYWGNNGQYFAISPPSAGFKLLPAWPAAGVTIANPAGSGFHNAVVSDLAVDGRVNNYIYAYSAWETTASGGNLTVQGVLVALNPANGATVWTVQLPATSLGAVSSSASDAGNAAPAVADDGTVYVGNGDGLRSIVGATGAVNWLFKSANVTSSPAIGGDGTVFFGVADGTVYAVNPNGSLRFKVTTGGRVSASPAIASNGTVYVTSDDGYLYAIK